MAGYTELIKNFEKVRTFTRDFFVYGFKVRNDYNELSPRTYDNERRRIESYLSELIVKKQDNKGKTISLSSNTTAKTSNPLFKVWQTKSFTRNDCFLHFVILDILTLHTCLSVAEIAEIISSNYTIESNDNDPIDTMTIRNKLNEYVKLGILRAEKKGKSLYYSLSENPINNLKPEIRESLDIALSYYMNILPAGFIGYSIGNMQSRPFIYRQIFFSQTLDDEVLLNLLIAIKNKQIVTLKMMSNKGSRGRRSTIVPLKILSNTKTGRRYAAIYNERNKKFSTVRLDYIKNVAFTEEFPGFDSVCAECQYLLKDSFSITHKKTESLQWVKMLLYVDEISEQYVIERIKREGKDGIITKTDENIFEYTIEVTDTLEMVPWLRTFTGRIIELEGSESRVIAQFKRDINTMMSLYNK